MSTIQNCKILSIPKIEDPRGNLSVIENDVIPFDIKRVYYLYDVPSAAERGGHSHIEQQEFLIALSGSFDVILNDGNLQKTVTLNKPFEGLLVKNWNWPEMKNLSTGAVCIVKDSNVFDEEDYIREFKEFLESKS